jgi:hypothetical protein
VQAITKITKYLEDLSSLILWAAVGPFERSGDVVTSYWTEALLECKNKRTRVEIRRENYNGDKQNAFTEKAEDGE